MMLRDLVIVPSEVIVVLDNLDVDLERPISDQVEVLLEDLLQAEANDVVFDLGWYPANNPEGVFRLVVVRDQNWDSPLFEASTPDPSVISWITSHALAQRSRFHADPPRDLHGGES